MSEQLTRRLKLFSYEAHRKLLSQGLRGIEREALRVKPDGKLSLTLHPIALGATLTHPQITTDYSESLLEFITPTARDIETVLAQLDAVHRFSYTALGDELLWSQSMPCDLPDEPEIPIATYGKSHIGMLKHVYRQGLALRYGRTMQCIAGIHYNFSMSEDIWRLLKNTEEAGGTAMSYQSESYISLLRNFHRYSWLLMYLFGASPAVAKQFMRGNQHGLQTLSEDTLYLPYATSLRMSDLGYQNNVQAGLMKPINSLRDYMVSLARAVREPYPPYEALGIQRNGEWVQINANILQVENEFYATIRPKRVIRTGERPLEALCSRGVQYIEVRCMDIDPFNPIGISLETSRFLDAFLHFCAFTDSPLTSEAEDAENKENFALTVKQGRRPGLTLHHNGNEIDLSSWGLELLGEIGKIADLLDAQHGDDVHAKALAAQKEKLLSPELTPSARVLAAIHEHGNSFKTFALQQSHLHAADFKSRPLSAAELAGFEEMAQTSLDEQAQIEATQTGDFDEFIKDYRARTPSHLCQ